MGELLNVLSETDGELTTPLDRQVITPLSTTTFRRTGSLNRRRRKTVTLSDHFDRERTLDTLPSPLSPLVESSKQRPSSMPESTDAKVPATSTPTNGSEAKEKVIYQALERRRHWTDRRSKSTLDFDTLARMRRDQMKPETNASEYRRVLDEEGAEPVAPPRRSRWSTTDRDTTTTFDTQQTPLSIDNTTPTSSPTKPLPNTPTADKGDTPTQRAMFEHSSGSWRNETTPLSSPSSKATTPTYDEGKDALEAWRRSRNPASELIEPAPKTTPLSRCNTLPHRWRSDVSESPSRRFTTNLSKLGGVASTEGGVVLAPTHRRQDDHVLSEGVESFRQREKSALDVGRLSRLQSLASRFRSAESDEDELNARRRSKKTVGNHGNAALCNNDNNVECGDRPSSFCKSDCDSVLSGRDEGFESTASQRTSMASNAEVSNLSGQPPECNKSESHLAMPSSLQYSQQPHHDESATTAYFACSIDSLVQNTPTDVGGSTPPTDEDDKWTTETYTVEHKVHNMSYIIYSLS